jgi:hypothetical protein
MPTSLPAAAVLDREFLAVRARLIDLAAALDRIDRAEGSVDGDQRLAKIRRSLEVLAGDATDRAQRLQIVFSLPYNENWQ